ncbi:MAG: indolepyruvate ferredoxin oxidoreductase, partial [Deltaproteobacteria bacterium]|nr:indolepyruvate ferredoxin oxidoreductase [Deltaproteobacteria bacterium]
MAKLKDRLVDPAAWSDLIMGNEALARAMIDTGTRVITTFPGSPTPEIGAALTAVAPEARPYRFEWSVNEKVALEVATGASLNGHPACCFFKSVGLNVASDSLVQLGLMELIGGMVVILGDDPGANSSQNEQDNRWFARMSYIPMLEPATPQEAYDMYREALRLSRERKMPVFLRLTTHVCHAREVVDVEPFDDGVADGYDWEPRFKPENGPYVPITVTVFPLKRKALAKLREFETWADTCAFNGVLAPGGAGKAPDGKRLGVVASSLAANSVIECLTAAGKPVDLLKLGVTYPLPRGLVAQFLADHDEVLVIEELDRVHETEIKALAYEEGAACKLLGRTDVEDLMGELGPRRTWGLLHGAWPDLFPP